MKKKIIAIAVAVALVFILLPTAALAYTDPANPAHAYNDHDYDALVAFFNTSGNGAKINPAYGAAIEDAPSGWQGTMGVSWTLGSDDEYHVSSIGGMGEWQIQDLTGNLDLSGFTELTGVYCSNNSLTSLDVTGDTKLGSVNFAVNPGIAFTPPGASNSLAYLQCDHCSITGTLDLTGLSNLQYLYCESNAGLTALGNLSDCTQLVRLDCSDDGLSGTLDVSACVSTLTNLDCSGNTGITGITGVAGSTRLQELKAYECGITGTADVHDAEGLETLELGGTTSLTGLNVSGCSGLRSLLFVGTGATDIDLSALTYIGEIDIQDNQSLASVALPEAEWAYYFNADGCEQITSLDLAGMPGLTDISTDGCLALQSIIANLGDADVIFAAAGLGYLDMEYVDEGQTHVIATPLTGASFVDWTESDYNTVISTTADYATVVGQSYDMVANFTAASYTVVFNTYGGGTIASQTVAANGTATQPADPVKQGNTFGGWYSDSAFATAYDFSSIINHNRTLFAKWISTGTPTTPVTPSSLTLHVGGRARLVPAVEGGTWQWDPQYLSAHHSVFTVTALKPGHTVIHYTIGWASADIPVTILDSTMPQTGQDFTPVYLLFVLSGCVFFISTFILYKKRNQKRKMQ